MRDIESVFLEKKDYRKNQLFLTLQNSEDQRCRINTLLQKYQYTRKTFNGDIAELKEEILHVYQEDLLEKTASDIILHQSKSSFLSFLLPLFYVRRSRNFQLFDILVQQEVQTFKQLQTKIFSSQSAIYQILKTLNQVVFPLKITFSLWGIEGEEHTIRSFLFMVYWSLFGGFCWPFSIEKESLLVIMNMEGFLKREITEFEREKTLFWMAITLCRLRKRCFISKGQPSKRMIPKWFGGYLALGQLKPEIRVSVEDEYSFFLRMRPIDTPPVYRLNQGRLASRGMVYYQSLNRLTNTNDEKGNWPLTIQLEERLLEHAKVRGWRESQCQNLIIQFRKIRHCMEEDLIDLCHWLDPKSLSYYMSMQSTIVGDIQELLRRLPKEVACLYVSECQQLGLGLRPSVRVQIHAKKGEVAPLMRLLDSCGNDSIELDQGSDRAIDILFTDVLSEYQMEQSVGNHCIFYEYPLKDAAIISELRKIIDLHFLNQEQECNDHEEERSM